MKSIRFSALLIATAMLVCFASCKKPVQDEEDWQSATDNATVESLHADADKAVDETADDNNLTDLQRGPQPADNEVMTGCATITIDSAGAGLGTTSFGGRAFPRKVTLDFGATPTLCKGRMISGKMFVNISKPHVLAGSIITQTFDAFKINGHSLEGTRTRTNLGADPSGHQQFKIDATNCKITDATGKVFSWSATHTRTWLAGFGTKSASDNIIEVTGNGSGVNRNGKAFSMVITSKMHIEGNCKWPQAGVIVVSRTGLLDRTIDFGTAGTCDDQATVSVNGQTRTITLPRN